MPFLRSHAFFSLLKFHITTPEMYFTFKWYITLKINVRDEVSASTWMSLNILYHDYSRLLLAVNIELVANHTISCELQLHNVLPLLINNSQQGYQINIAVHANTITLQCSFRVLNCHNGITKLISPECCSSHWLNIYCLLPILWCIFIRFLIN